MRQENAGSRFTDLVAKQDIHEAVMRYCRGIDRLDMALVRSAYHSGGTDHHDGFEGSVEEFVAWVEPLLTTLDGTRHEVANHLSEVAGVKAVAESYVVARHWGSSRSMNFTTGIRYVDHFEKQDGVWAIVERFAVHEWTRRDIYTRYGPFDGPLGTRDGDDPVFRLARQLD